VVVIAVDSLRADHLHHAGDPRPLSPRLDALAGESARFLQARSSAPWTTPAVMTLLTGLQPSSHHVDHNDRALSDAVPTLAERFRRAGYATAAVMPALTLADHFGFDRGFDEFIFEAQGHGNVSGPWSLGHALDLLRRHRARPLFLYLHLWDVHYNYNPPLPHAARFQAGRRAGPDETDDVTWLTRPGNAAADLAPERVAWLEGQYAGEILFTDEQIGRLLDELAAQERAGETIVVVTADHGEGFLEHGALGHTVSIYDEMVRVPLLVRYPGVVPPDRSLHGPAGLVDLAPTLLDLAGLPYRAEEFDGRSLAPVLRGEEAVFDGPPALLQTSRRGWWRGLADGRWSYLLDLATGRQELYDLTADPGQQRNLASERPEEARAWRRRLCGALARTPATGEIGFEPLPEDLKARLDAGLRTLGYVGAAGASGGRSGDPGEERRRVLAAAGCGPADAP
jgi:arylsulfatase A-like enzyme